MLENYPNVQFENAPLGCATIRVADKNSQNSIKYVFERVNPVFEMITGLKSSEIYQKNVQEVMMPILWNEFNWNKFCTTTFSKEFTVSEADGYSESLQKWLKLQFYPSGESFYTLLVTDITQEKNKSEELENFFSINFDLLCIADLEGNFVKANAAWSKILGYSTEDLSQRKYLDFVHPEDIPSLVNAIAQMKDEHDTTGTVTRFLCKDGTYHHIEWRSFRKQKQVYISSRDITDINLVNEKLKKHNERLKSLVKILEYKTNNTQSILNHALEELVRTTDSRYGYIYYYSEEKEEFILNSWSKDAMKECSVVEPQTTYYLKKTGIWGEAVRQRKPIMVNDFEKENPLKKGYPAGHVLLKRFLTIPIFSNGQIVAVAGVANKEQEYDHSDIVQMTLLMNDVWKTTEKIRSEQALFESNELWQSIIKASPIGISTTNLDGKITSTSPAAVAMWGYNSDREIIGRNIFEFVDESDHTIGKIQFERMLKGEKIAFAEYLMVRKDGSKFYAECDGVLLHDSQGNPSGVLFTEKDVTERKQAEEALHISEEKYRSLVESIEDIILTVNLEGIFTYVSPAWTLLLGHPVEQIIGSPYSLYIHPDDIAHCMSNMQKAVEGQEYISNIEYRVRHLDGSWRWHSSSSSSLKDKTGKLIGLYGIARDITLRKNAEEALRQSEEKYRLLVENTQDIIYTTDMLGIFTFVSSAWTELLGHPVSEIIGESFAKFVHPDDISRGIEYLKAIFLTRERAKEVEYRVRHIDGNWHWHTTSGSPMKDKFGNVIGIYGIARDITERKLFEKALKESQELYQSILKASPDNITVTDMEGFIQMISPAGVKMAGFNTEKEVIGHHVTDFMLPDDREMAIKNFYRMKQGEAIETGEYRVLLPNGNFIFFEENGELLRDIEGNPFGAVFILRDVTNRKMAENEIKTKNEQLQKLNAEKDKLFSVIAHDLRGPFNALLGLSELMVEEIEELGLEKLLKIAVSFKKSSEDLYQLLENLLSWSRVQQNRIIVEPEPLVLTSKIEQNVNILTEIAKKKNISININIPKDIVILADESMFDSIIRNLVSNAIKFTQRNGCIIISAKLTIENFVEISIRDNGIGMSKEILKNLFSLDKKTNRRGTENEPSTGLGLIICKDFIERHGGEIHIESEEGKGSTFFMTIPCANISHLNR